MATNIPNNGIQNAVGNNVYPDLVLTRFPDNFDERSGAKLNPNMLRWLNLDDYNMAEHVNTLQDSLMAIQRVLGESVQLPASLVKDDGTAMTAAEIAALKKSNTVKSRLNSLENKNYDKRYGGPNWVPDTGVTLEQHRHTGGVGKPSKIDLESEVTNELPVKNLDLTQTATGLTGAKIKLNSTNTATIDAAISDKLSQKEGGTIQKNLTVVGKTQTRTSREYDYTDMSGTVTADNQTLLNACVKSDPLAETYFLNKKFSGLYYGRYVLIVRAKTDTRIDGNLLQLFTVSKTGDSAESITLKGTDFKAANQWQNFYLIFTHEPNTSGGEGEFRVRKMTTASSATVSLDYALITPTHPAVFDR